MNDMIVVDNVCKRFNLHPRPEYNTLKEAIVRGLLFRNRGSVQYVEALKDISFSVPEGTVLGIIGPNGAGKSTLLRLLARIYRPDSGKVFVKGKVSALLNLGIGFHPDLTGRENVVISGLALGLSRRQIRNAFDEIVHFAELENFIDAPVRTYSSGMFMRLAFSIAVHINPDILLLDEVLAVGDASFAQKSRACMEKFKEQGKTILLVTHDLATAVSWCHHTLWLEKGQVQALGDSKDVVARYIEKMTTNLQEGKM